MTGNLIPFGEPAAAPTVVPGGISLSDDVKARTILSSLQQPAFPLEWYGKLLENYVRVFSPTMPDTIRELMWRPHLTRHSRNM